MNRASRGYTKSLVIVPWDLVMCPLNFSEGHYYSNVALTSAVHDF